MIEHIDGPRGRYVAIFAGESGFDVVFAFASCHIVVVAAEAAFDDWAVIDVDGFPVRRGVAV